MPCCSTVLTAAAADSSTPSWLRRLHNKGGLSFPSNLRIDDLLYGQRRALPPPPPPPPPPSSNEPPPPPNPNHHQQPPRRSTNPSRPNPSSSNPQPPQLQLSTVVSDLFVIPSSVPLATMPPKTFRKQKQPRTRPDKSNKDNKGKVKKRRRSDRAADADGERCNKTEVTVIDSSIDGWKAAKLVLRRGAVWKIRDKKPWEITEPVDSTKAKRRAGLVSKIKRDREKEKHKEKEAATSSGNIHANSGDMVKESDDPIPIQTLKRFRCSEPEPEGQITAILH